MSWRRSYAYEQLMVRMVYMMGLTLTGSLGFVIYARYVGDFVASSRGEDLEKHGERISVTRTPLKSLKYTRGDSNFKHF